MTLLVGQLRLGGKVILDEELPHLVVAPGVPDLIMSCVEHGLHGLQELIALAGNINSSGVRGIRGPLHVVLQQTFIPSLSTSILQSVLCSIMLCREYTPTE